MASRIFWSGSGSLAPFDPSHRFVTSWCLSPYALFGLRAFLAFYALLAQFFSLGWQCTHDEVGGCLAARMSFSYFTILTYWGLGWYLLVAAVHTWTYARSRTPTRDDHDDSQGVALLDRLPRPLQTMHAVFYASVTVFPLIVTTVYWARLYSGTWFPVTFDAWHNVSMHAMNAAFALVEVVLPRTAPLPWPHLPWLIVLLALYLALAYLTHATTGIYVYNFLDSSAAGVGSRGLVAAYIFGVALGCIVFFIVVRYLIVLRIWLTETRPSQNKGLDAEMAENNVILEQPNKVVSA